MKRKLASILALALIVGALSGCTAAEKPAEQPTDTKPAQSEPAKPEEKPTEAPAEQPIEQPTETPAETPAEEPAESPEEPKITGDDYIGEWISVRPFITVNFGDYYGTYAVNVHWSSSYNSFSTWDMTAAFNEETGALEYTDGVRYDFEITEEGEEKSVLAASETSGSLLYDGRVLIWTDSDDESDASDIEFEKTSTYAPSAEAITEDVLKPMLAYSSGSEDYAVKNAYAAYKALAFSDHYTVFANDKAELKAAVEEAIAGLSAEEKAQIADNVLSVNSAIVTAAVDWENYKHNFIANNCEEEMQTLLEYRGNLDGWQFLMDDLFEAAK